MTFDLERCLAIDGFMVPEELEWLYTQASSMENVVEVGCWKGRSTAALAQGCKGTVWTVDHFEGSPAERDGAHQEASQVDLYSLALNTLRFDNVRILRMESVNAARLFRPGSVDMIFIDGDHSLAAILADLILWNPVARKLLCGHDRNWVDVERALSIYGLPFREGPGSIWFTEVLP